MARWARRGGSAAALALVLAAPARAGQDDVDAALAAVRTARAQVGVLVTAETPEDLAAAWGALEGALDALDTALVLAELEAALGAAPGEPEAPGDSEFAVELAALEAALDAAEQSAAAGPGDPEEAVEVEVDWLAALPRATRYGRPDRTSESNLDDGSHYDQSSDDRVYRERCVPGAAAGIDVSIRPGTETLHWRWRTGTGDPAGVREWRAFVNGEWLGEVGNRIVRVADTDVTWYEYEPPRTREEGRFAILFACAGVQELEIHYHH